MLFTQRQNAGCDQVGLYRRATRRVDLQRNRVGLAAKRLIERLGQAGKVQLLVAAGRENAAQPNHRHAGGATAERPPGFAR